MLIPPLPAVALGWAVGHAVFRSSLHIDSSDPQSVHQAIQDIRKSFSLFNALTVMLGFFTLAALRIWQPVPIPSFVHVAVTSAATSVLAMDLYHDLLFPVAASAAAIERTRSYYTILFQVRVNPGVIAVLGMQPMLSVYMHAASACSSHSCASPLISPFPFGVDSILAFASCCAAYALLLLIWNALLFRRAKHMHLLYPMQQEALPGERLHAWKYGIVTLLHVFMALALVVTISRHLCLSS